MSQSAEFEAVCENKHGLAGFPPDIAQHSRRQNSMTCALRMRKSTVCSVIGTKA